MKSQVKTMKDTEVIKIATKIIDELIKLLAVSAESHLAMKVDDNEKKFLDIEISGKDAGLLIGYRGNTLSAIQVIFSQMLSKAIGEQMNVFIDINGYRAKRNGYLVSLAERAAREVKENGQSVSLPPLSPYERRVVHLSLAKSEDILTESIGEGEERHIVVKLKMKNEKSKIKEERKLKSETKKKDED